MGTSGSTAFALDQSHLRPVLQLALIVVADSASVYFTREEAISVVVSGTNMNEAVATSAIDRLIKQGLISFDGHNYFVQEAHLPNFPGKAAREPVVRDFSGYVYLLQSPQGAFKIGKTINPKSRYQTFKTSLPFKVDYICLIKTNRMSELEKELHQKFTDKRINGEWFSLSSNDVIYIMSLGEVDNG
jgi:hypothetical protein